MALEKKQEKEATLMDVRAKTADLDPRQEEVTSVAPCAGPAASPDTHEFSFRVKDFNSWVGRDRERQLSDVWHMGPGMPHVRGGAVFHSDKTVAMFLFSARCPCNASSGARKVKVTVTAVRQEGAGQDWQLREWEGEVVEGDEWGGSGGCTGRISCGELVQQGYVTGDVLLLRYTVTLL